MDDFQFVKQLKAKDQVAWQEAYRRYYAKTESYLRTIKYPIEKLKDDAKDIWQETVIVLYIYLGKGNEPNDLGAYVFGIMRNLCLKKLKEKGREVPIEEDYTPAEDNTYERVRLTHEIATDILGTMKKQKGLKHCAEIIRLFFLERKKDREIAAQIGLKEDYIKVRRSQKCLPYFKTKFQKHYKYQDLKN